MHASKRSIEWTSITSMKRLVYDRNEIKKRVTKMMWHLSFFGGSLITHFLSSLSLNDKLLDFKAEEGKLIELQMHFIWQRLKFISVKRFDISSRKLFDKIL